MVTDEQQIANLIYGYAEAVDRGDFEAVGRFFEDATYRASIGADEHVLRGAQAVTKQMSAVTRRYEDGTPHTCHQTTNLLIEVDDDRRRATCRSRFVVVQAVDAEPKPILAGRYHDAFERL